MAKELLAAGAEGYAVLGGKLSHPFFLESQQLLLEYDGRPREFRQLGLLPSSLNLEMLLNGSAAEGFRIVRELLEIAEYDDDDWNYDDDVTWMFLMEATDPALPVCQYRAWTSTDAVLDDDARRLLEAGFEIVGAFGPVVVLEICPDAPRAAETSEYKLIDLDAKKEVVLGRVKEAADEGYAVLVASNGILVLKREPCQDCAGDIVPVEMPNAFGGGWHGENPFRIGVLLSPRPGRSSCSLSVSSFVAQGSRIRALVARTLSLARVSTRDMLMTPDPGGTSSHCTWNRSS
jgi:hypothetical protein